MKKNSLSGSVMLIETFVFSSVLLKFVSFSDKSIVYLSSSNIPSINGEREALRLATDGSVLLSLEERIGEKTKKKTIENLINY